MSRIKHFDPETVQHVLEFDPLLPPTQMGTPDNPLIDTRLPLTAPLGEGEVNMDMDDTPMNDLP